MLTDSGVKCPAGAHAGFVGSARDLDETIIERERVVDGILPGLMVLSTEWAQVHDALIVRLLKHTFFIHAIFRNEK